MHAGGGVYDRPTSAHALYCAQAEAMARPEVSTRGRGRRNGTRHKDDDFLMDLKRNKDRPF
jgi:hypothetical protein